MKSCQTAHHDYGAAMRAGEPLRLHNLRLPFAVRLTAHMGRHRLAGDRRAGVLDEGASLDLPAYRTLHYEGPVIADARAGHRLHLLIDEYTAPAQRSPADDLRIKLAIRLARAVFRDPASDWSLSMASQHMGMTRHALATQLFREGSALTPIVREQRLMRALLAALAASPGHMQMAKLAVQTGFVSVKRFDMMFSRHFGCGVGQLEKRAWSPALTWSAVNHGSPGRGGAPSCLNAI
ncbi:helix-turn-helix transcriptional regulator [Paraburkholderia domus]|uniref:hypothetical protein n=1 Tax=Paraburkholderia domus TaxID=2793075 RepID=UPI001B08DC3A|nr:hypothetical protein [Paraburkholderia domus]CAE6821631.1 hypothetical protein R75483_06274 [Paraburkholderia domus]